MLGFHSIERRAAPSYDCGGMIDSPGEVIKSPNFPNNYDNGIECKWVIAFNHRNMSVPLPELKEKRTLMISNIDSFLISSTNSTIDFYF